MKILVTGGAGFVGSVLVPRLLDVGHQVTVLDSLRSSGHGLLGCFHNPAFEFVQGDVRNTEDVKQAVADVDAVVHLAAIVGYPACRKYPTLAQDTNVTGTQNIVDALADKQTLVYASTGSNYGKLETVCTEESPLNPISLYGITKTEAEKISLTHPKGVALRFATAFGVSPRMRLDLMVNDFVHKAIVDKQLIVYERHFRRTFINVRDMAGSMIFALDNIETMAGESYNVGHESMNLTKEDIAQVIRKRVPFYLHFADIGMDEDQRDYEVSYEKIRKVGFQTSVTIDEGIEELVRAMGVVQDVNPYGNV